MLERLVVRSGTAGGSWCWGSRPARSPGNDRGRRGVLVVAAIPGTDLNAPDATTRPA